MKAQRRLLPGSVAVAVVAAAHCTAGPFQYINGDLLACFRTEGGATDLVVNLGPATQLKNLPWGTRVTLSDVTADRLAAVLYRLVPGSGTVLNTPGDLLGILEIVP